MGALDGVQAMGVGVPLWTVGQPMAMGGGSAGEPVTSNASPGGTLVEDIRAGNAIEAAAERASSVRQPGDADGRDEAWLPALTELPDRPFRYQIELRIDQATGRVVARVIDRESGEVVRQVPPEYVLQLATYIDAWLGRVLDTRA